MKHDKKYIEFNIKDLLQFCWSATETKDNIETIKISIDLICEGLRILPLRLLLMVFYHIFDTDFKFLFVNIIYSECILFDFSLAGL